MVGLRCCASILVRVGVFEGFLVSDCLCMPNHCVPLLHSHDNQLIHPQTMSGMAQTVVVAREIEVKNVKYLNKVPQTAIYAYARLIASRWHYRKRVSNGAERVCG